MFYPFFLYEVKSYKSTCRVYEDEFMQTLEFDFYSYLTNQLFILESCLKSMW